ncbi:MAG: hypothetical protein M3256_25840 [Actinomycetota bacterium]|nr:hypothetical protein [Actinomycetota bacterium]
MRRLAQLPAAVGSHAGMPFVLDDYGHPIDELNRWLRSLPTSGIRDRSLGPPKASRPMTFNVFSFPSSR